MVPVEFLELLAAAEKLYEFQNLILTRAGVAGYRQTDDVAAQKVANQISAEFGDEWGLREWAPLYLDDYAMELCTY